MLKLWRRADERRFPVPVGRSWPWRTIKRPGRVLRVTLVAVLAIGIGAITVVSGVSGLAAASSSMVDPFTSSWDLPLSPDAVIGSNSSELVAHLVTQYEDKGGAVGVNGGDFEGYHIVTVPARQAYVPIDETSGCYDFTSDTGDAVPIPPSAASLVSGIGDSPLIVWQPSTDTEWEFWQATDASGTWHACWGGEISDVSASHGVFPAPYGLAASGISYLGTMITEADVESGSIDHTIAVQVEQNDCNGYVAPADRTDCRSARGQVAEGQELRFPPTLAMPSGLSAFGQMVFEAIKNYGMIVTDQSEGVDIPCETGADWTTAGNTGTDPITASWGPAGTEAYQALDGVPWSQLEVVYPALHIAETSLPSGEALTPYSQHLSVSGENPPYRWSVSSGSLPKGLRLSASAGTIAGEPLAGGISTFTVKVVGREATTTQELSIDVAQPVPVITLVRPASGPVAGGTRVTIEGTSLEGVSSVHFGDAPATAFSVNRAGTRIIAYAPAADVVGTALITLTTPGGNSVLNMSDQFSYS